MDRFVARNDSLVIDLDSRNAARRGSRRDDDLARLERLLSRRRRSSIFPPPRELRGPLDPGDLVLLEQELDALGEAADDLVFPRVDLRHVDRGRTLRNDDSPLLRVLNDLQRMSVLEQRLRWNASPDQTGAAKRLLLFNDGDRLPELRGPDGRHIAAGTRADHYDIVRIGRHNRLV